MTRKTIAQHMKDVLIEEGYDTVGWGSLGHLDECAIRCTHTNLIELHPLTRHQRILDALDKSALFTKFMFRLDIFQNNQSRLVRGFTLADSEIEEIQSLVDNIDLNNTFPIEQLWHDFDSEGD